VRDDFTRPLGDPVEARFAAALEFRRSQTCPAPTGSGGPGLTKPLDGFSDQSGDGLVRKSPWLMNRSLEGA
jgi:hypothetical protein